MMTTETTHAPSIQDLKQEFIAYRLRMNDEPDIHVFSDLFLIASFVRQHEFLGGPKAAGAALLAAKLAVL